MKRNGRGPNEEVEIVDASQTEILSSGVKVTVLPFPARLHDSIQAKAQEKFPEPKPPKKIIKVVDGSEEVDDTSNPVYLEEKNRIQTERDQWIGQRVGENVLDLCILIDVAPYGHIIKKLEKSLDEPAPTDSEELRDYFLTHYALRGRADYERVTSVALTLMAVGDKEIQSRMDSFRNQMEGAIINRVETPSPDAT